MAVTKLNPAAPPFHCHYPQHHLPPPPPPRIPLYHVAACPPPFPIFTTYCCTPFPVPAPRHPHYPYLPPAPRPPPAFPCKRVPAPPHGRPPHKLMMVSSGAFAAEKLQAQAVSKAPVAVAVKAAQEPPAAAAAPRPRRVVVPRCGLRVHPQAGSSRTKECRPRQAAPVSCASPARSTSPEFTTGTPVPVRAAARLGRSVTTVMIRNIPNKLTHCEIMRLLDDHCARVNNKSGAVFSAYDFLYVPMDFSKSRGRRSSNMGYAFVNFTTAEAARRLQRSLNGCCWKVFGSQKIIAICAAHIQGKDALVKHFSRSTFACHTDEFLPAVFSPPRDGAGDPNPKRVGHRVPPLFRLTLRRQLTARPACTEAS